MRRIGTANLLPLAVVAVLIVFTTGAWAKDKDGPGEKLRLAQRDLADARKDFNEAKSDLAKATKERDAARKKLAATRP